MKKPLLFLLITLFSLISLLLLTRNLPFHQAVLDANHVKDNEKLLQSPKTLYGVSLDSMRVSKAVFQPNEILSEVLSRYQVSWQTIAQIGQLPREEFNVRSLQANKPYTVIHPVDTTQAAKTFVYHPNPIDYIALHFGDSVSVEHGRMPVDTIHHSLAGVINTSLYQAIIESGGSPVLVNELADVYAWAIDFFGLQAGDCFKVLYTTYEVQGEEAGFGSIEAAEFAHLGNTLYAFSFDQGDGREYFDEEGNSLRKTFLKAPLRFSRISSRFSYSRLHPILKIRRPHLGVDYAAPTGTPVYSVGDGIITKAAYSGGAGRMIKVQHNSNYTTAYLHLSRYAKGIRPGLAVRQGQVIGYVGSSGLSTGPHLDFRFYKNGRAVDPLRVESPSAEPICEELRPDFEVQMRIWLKKLNQIQEDPNTILVANYSTTPQEQSSQLH